MVVEGSSKEGCMPNSLAGHSAVNRGGFVPFAPRREQTGVSSRAGSSSRPRKADDGGGRGGVHTFTRGKEEGTRARTGDCREG